jgi:hypothetical protein
MNKIYKFIINIAEPLPQQKNIYINCDDDPIYINPNNINYSKNPNHMYNNGVPLEGTIYREIIINLNAETDYLNLITLLRKSDTFPDEDLFKYHSMLGEASFMIEKYTVSNYSQIGQKYFTIHNIIHTVVPFRAAPYDDSSIIKFPYESRKSPQMTTLELSCGTYILPVAILNAMQVIRELKEVLGADSLKSFNVPENLVPYIDKTIKLLNTDLGDRTYNLAMLSVLDWLGFPIDIIINGFIILNDTLVTRYQLLNSGEYMNQLLLNGYIVRGNFIRTPPLPAVLAKDIVPLSTITDEVARRAAGPVGVDSILSTKKDIYEMCILKILMRKYYDELQT